MQSASLGQEDTWRGAWQPTPVFLSGEPHGQRSLVGYSPWGHKESDKTEATWHTQVYLHFSQILPQIPLYLGLNVEIGCKERG